MLVFFLSCDFVVNDSDEFVVEENIIYVIEEKVIEKEVVKEIIVEEEIQFTGLSNDIISNIYLTDSFLYDLSLNSCATSVYPPDLEYLMEDKKSSEQIGYGGLEAYLSVGSDVYIFGEINEYGEINDQVTMKLFSSDRLDFFSMTPEEYDNARNNWTEIYIDNSLEVEELCDDSMFIFNVLEEDLFVEDSLFYDFMFKFYKNDKEIEMIKFSFSQ